MAFGSHSKEVVLPTTKHTHTIIFLHGRDSTAGQFAGELFESQGKDGRFLQEIVPGTKWVFPSAEMIPAARYDNVLVSQRFDMHSTENPHQDEEEKGFEPAVQRLHRIIDDEAAVIGHGNIVLAGISQGAAIGLHVLLGQERRLGGFIGLSTWAARSNELDKLNGEAFDTPVLLSHQRGDPVIGAKFGEELRDHSRRRGLSVEWCVYEADEHWLHEPEGVDDISKFLKDKAGFE